MEAWNRFISSEIERFLTAFQRIEITITPPKAAEPVIVPVHAPYMMQTVTWIEGSETFGYLKKRQQDRLLRVKAARDQAPEPVKQFLQRWLTDENGRERLLAAGRATLREMQNLLQEAVDRQLVPLPDDKSHLDGRALRHWLQIYGIGVDCSSFVQQALNRLGTAVGLDGTVKIRSLRSFRAYDEIKKGIVKQEPLFESVAVPATARPGDVLVKYGHIRIVSGIERGDGNSLILHLAESTSAPDIPTGQTEDEADIGPRRLQLCYPEPQRPISEQQPRRKRQHDPDFQPFTEETAYVLGRMITLSQFCQTHSAPDATA